MTEKFADRRRSRRIDVMLPVILENARAVTRDTRASGVFFWKRGTFMYGDSIRFAIERMTKSGRMLQKCRGVVIRTEPDDQGVGVAARITESTTERVPRPVGAAHLLKPPRAEPRNITLPRDDALASAIETANRWSSLLRKKALEARDELRDQQMLEWDIPLTADLTTAQRSVPWSSQAQRKKPSPARGAWGAIHGPGKRWGSGHAVMRMSESIDDALSLHLYYSSRRNGVLFLIAISFKA